MPSNDYGGVNGGSSAGGAMKDYRGTSVHAQDESSAAIEQQLDPEQLQLFAQENQDMLKQYEDQLDKVRYVTLLSDKSTANRIQRCREVARGGLRAAVNTRQQPRDSVSAHRAACGGLVQHDGECRERKQGAEASDGEKEHSADGLLRHVCILHIACSVGPVHMTHRGLQSLQRSAAH